MSKTAILLKPRHCVCFVRPQLRNALLAATLCGALLASKRYAQRHG